MYLIISMLYLDQDIMRRCCTFKAPNLKNSTMQNTLPCKGNYYFYKIMTWFSIFYRAPDKERIFISIMPISSPTPMFDHLLESSLWDDSKKWSNIGVGEEMTQEDSVEVYFTRLICFSDLDQIDEILIKRQFKLQFTLQPSQESTP